MCSKHCHCEMQFCNFVSGCTKGKDIVKRLSLTNYNACDTWYIPLLLYLIFIYRCSFFLPIITMIFFRISPSVSAIARGFFLPKRKRSARWSFILVEFSAILELFIFHYHEDSEKYICTNQSFRIGMASQSAYWNMSDNGSLCT